MDCELDIPVTRIGLYPVETDLGSMAVELTAREPTGNQPEPGAVCAIRVAIVAHLKAKRLLPQLPDSFLTQVLCRRCGDQVTFSAE